MFFFILCGAREGGFGVIAFYCVVGLGWEKEWPRPGASVTNEGPRPRVRKLEATDEFEPSRTAYETVGQPMGAAVEWWKIGNSNPVRVLARALCCRLH